MSIIYLYESNAKLYGHFNNVLFGNDEFSLISHIYYKLVQPRQPISAVYNLELHLKIHSSIFLPIGF